MCLIGRWTAGGPPRPQIPLLTLSVHCGRASKRSFRPSQLKAEGLASQVYRAAYRPVGAAGKCRFRPLRRSLWPERRRPGPWFVTCTARTCYALTLVRRPRDGDPPPPRAFPSIPSSRSRFPIVVELLAEESVSAESALDGAGISPEALRSPKARVSDQPGRGKCYRIALSGSQSGTLQFAYHAGLRGHHLSSYGLYGFAMLSSPSFSPDPGLSRCDTIGFATPLADLSVEQRTLVGRGGRYTPWLIHSSIQNLYRFLVDMYCGILHIASPRLSGGRPSHPGRYSQSPTAPLRMQMTIRRRSDVR